MLTHELFNTQTELLYFDHGPPPHAPHAPVLLYLPGVQGDWTPLWGLAPLLAREFRLVVTAYPRQHAWSLGDHARAAERLLAALGIARAHVLAESFGSLVGLRLALAAPGRVCSLVLAGGFCQPPTPLARAARRVCAWAPPRLLDALVAGYVRLHAGPRLRAAPELRAQAFLAVRSRPGWLACANRMRLIADTDLRPRLGELRLPVAYFGGTRDAVVPVRREVATLRGALHPACRFRAQLFKRMPHPILPAHPQGSLEFLRAWVREVEAPHAEA